MLYYSCMVNKNFLSTTEVAKKLGISRISVYKRIKSGSLPARQIGRNFVIDPEDVPELFAVSGQIDKREIDNLVKKTVVEYGETLRLLGKE